MHKTNKLNKKVSVVITCFNNQETIYESILSAIHQSHDDLQIIVVDDASTDQSASIIRSIQDARIEFIQLSNNVGVSAARNIGFNKAHGEFITQLDGDDTYHPNKVQNELQACLSEPGSVSASLHISVGRSGATIFRLQSRASVTQLSPIGLLYRMEQFHRDWMIPRNLLQSCKYDEGVLLYEDWDFMLKVISATPVIILPSVGTYYRRSHSGLSRKPWKRHRSALRKIFSNHCSSRVGRFLFSAITINKYVCVLFTLILAKTGIYKSFPN